MDEDFPALQPSQYLKTYTKTNKKLNFISKAKVSTQFNSVSENSVGKAAVKVQVPLDENKSSSGVRYSEIGPLSTRNAVKYLIEGSLKTKVCRYCLNHTANLSPLDQILEVANNGSLYKMAIKEMVATFHPFKVDDDPNFPNKICDKCIDNTITSYLFAQQCERAERALLNCFEDIYDKLDKLDPLERPKKRGRQKLKPNHNVIHVEHEKVIDYAEPLFHLINTCESLSVGMPINDLECLKCCEVLPSLESLLNHSKSHPKSMWFNCRLCGRSFAKLCHLKKHLRLDHENPVELNDQGTVFNCSTCGLEYKDYYKYLQHIEKHKFKNVMAHLVEKKMDKFCLICLNQGGDMTSLDKRICLHGGSSNLVGDQPLHSILASTLPESKNKYQELLLPRQASIMKFIKKSKPDTQKNIKFIFSKPIPLTEDEDHLNHFYLFFFAEPQLLNSNKIEADKNEKYVETEADKNEKYVETEVNSIKTVAAQDSTSNTVQEVNIIHSPEKIEEDCDVTKDSPTENKQVFNETVKFVFSNPSYIILQKIDSTVPANKDDIESNRDAIFDEICTETTEGTGEAVNNSADEASVAEENHCKFCWVFKHSNKCDICEKHNCINNNGDLPMNIDSANNNTLNYSKNDENVIGIKRNSTAWRCNICLTNNRGDTVTCYCCESSAANNDQKIYIFKKIEVKAVPKEFKVEETTTPTKYPSIELKIHENVIQPQYNFSQFQPDTVILNSNNNNIIPITNINNNKPLQQEDVCLMDTEIVEVKPSIPFLNSLPSFEIEAMDTECIELQNILRPVQVDFGSPSNTSNTSLTPTHFQFSMGTGEKSSRKNKRPFRNISKAFNK